MFLEQQNSRQKRGAFSSRFFFWSRSSSTDLEFILVFIIAFNSEALAFSFASFFFFTILPLRHPDPLSVTTQSTTNSPPPPPLVLAFSNNPFSFSFDRSTYGLGVAACCKIIILTELEKKEGQKLEFERANPKGERSLSLYPSARNFLLIAIKFFYYK